MFSRATRSCTSLRRQRKSFQGSCKRCERGSHGHAIDHGKLTTDHPRGFTVHVLHRRSSMVHRPSAPIVDRQWSIVHRRALPLFRVDIVRPFLLSSPPQAGIAQLVEHNLAKVGVAGSNPVSRSSSSCRGRGQTCSRPRFFSLPTRQIASLAKRRHTRRSQIALGHAYLGARGPWNFSSGVVTPPSRVVPGSLPAARPLAAAAPLATRRDLKDPRV